MRTKTKTDASAPSATAIPEYEIADGEREASFNESLFVRHHPESEGHYRITVRSNSAAVERPYPPDVRLEIAWSCEYLASGDANDTGSVTIPIAGSVDGLDAFVKLLAHVVTKSRALGHLTPLTRE